jgi:hypothetical protein
MESNSRPFQGALTSQSEVSLSVCSAVLLAFNASAMVGV